MKALHIFAVHGKVNSGDFFLGPSTKNTFEKMVSKDIQWTNFNVRKLVTPSDVEYFNKFDALIIGGGGLFLPDTNPNLTSCWQWACSSSLMRKIQTKIYVVGIGWNHFYNQTIGMPNRNNSMEFDERFEVFKDNAETLIDKSVFFSMRHKGDVERLRSHVDSRFHDKIIFEFCPVIDYVKYKYSHSFSTGDYHTFEIKDDRPNRRYHKKNRDTFYNELLLFIKGLISKGEKIAVMSHDGSSTFIRFLQSKSVPFLFLNNTVANEKKIVENYSKVKKLYCTAGHSQMMAYALELPFYSLITHDKLKYFLEDKGMFSEENYCMVNDQDINSKIGNK